MHLANLPPFTRGAIGPANAATKNTKDLRQRMHNTWTPLQLTIPQRQKNVDPAHRKPWKKCVWICVKFLMIWTMHLNGTTWQEYWLQDASKHVKSGIRAAEQLRISLRSLLQWMESRISKQNSRSQIHLLSYGSFSVYKPNAASRHPRNVFNLVLHL